MLWSNPKRDENTKTRIKDEEDKLKGDKNYSAVMKE